MNLMELQVWQRAGNRSQLSMNRSLTRRARENYVMLQLVMREQFKKKPGEIGHHKACYSVLLILGQVTTALIHVDGVVTHRSEWEKSLNAYRVEASWRLGQWDSLESYLKLERGVA
ncbi:hypothetical protein OS493_037048 [Desmophyllum pertusum]|uniref:Uncharacterized protein n=1 Tax=Desmophyllum pertusum TaxID=174260 RepID=A0A9W9ZVB1_9CNID|nr:hypothetical protein OS493_037048 [Desmophyllum pertusum]